MSERAAPCCAPAAVEGSVPAPAPVAAPRKPDVAASRLVAVLAGGGAVAGLLLVLAYSWTLVPIRAHRARVLAEGVREVLGLSEADPYDSFWLEGDALTAREPADHRPAALWRGRRADGTVVGWAIDAKEPGFSDEIHLIFGWDAARRRVIALKVLEQRETPGLGDEIQRDGDDAFATRFRGRAAPIRGTRRGQGSGSDAEVDTITGATISSRAVIRIVNHAVERWGPRIEAWREETPR